MNIATSYQGWKISKAIKEQLPHYPHTHLMANEDLVENAIPPFSPNSIFLGVSNASSEWYDPDNQILFRKAHLGNGRITGYKLEVCLQ